ncbi:MAG: DNA adenine methylase, partial [Gammaproteobacteria bacterium]
MTRGALRKPFLKWPGGKIRVVPKLLEVLPRGKRLIEPFVGSGAVFLNTNFDSYLLADTNADLINLFGHIKHEGDAFIDYCRP